VRLVASLPLIRFSLRGVLCLALTASVTAAPVLDARASVSVAITFDALVQDSSAVVIGTPTEQRSVWEGAHIYTYSRMHVDSPIVGKLDRDDELWVRTMGGIVGKVGQIVEGEADLTLGRPSLFFLRRSPAGIYVVSAHAQGQFGLYTDEQMKLRVRKSSAVGALFQPRGTDGTAALAAEVIHGRTVAEAAQSIAMAWNRTHASD
jgi:hypothetical protein